MQQYNLNAFAPSTTQTSNNTAIERQTTGMPTDMQMARAAERARLRQGIIHVRIRHFYCTLEEMIDPSLRGQCFVVGTGTGRPNEPGRVIDASPAAMRLGVSPGMPLRRAHRLAPRTRFLPASYDRYQPILQRLRERLTALIGIANGKAIAELAALMSRKDGRQGVLYIPPGREASFVQTLPLAMLLQLRAAGTGIPSALPELGEQQDSSSSHPPEVEGKSESVDSVAVAELVAHLRDFGVTSFAQVAALTEDGLRRRLGQLGVWVYQVARGEDVSLVVPDAPPLSQNARVRFNHAADADETCAAIRKLANYLGDRLREQRLKGQVIALMLWPNRFIRRETRKLVLSEEGEEVAVTAAEETIGGQMILSRHTDEADVIAHHALMLFAQYHRQANRYLQVQLRIGDIVAVTQAYYPPLTRSRGRPTRKL